MTGDLDSRQKTIIAAATLFCRNGYQGTALSDILEAAGSPRGSLYFHFPAGKEEIGVAALAFAGEQVRQVLADAAKSSKSASEFLLGVARIMAANLEKSDFREACPVAPTALEMAGHSATLNAASRAAFQSWEEEIRRALEGFKLKPDKARSLATAVLSQLEGALLLARTYRSLEPMKHAEEVIDTLLRSSRRS
jgi:TetR/AcrR family transcriptional regulator, lmrAB and yxaGH operons repressor